MFINNNQDKYVLQEINEDIARVTGTKGDRLAHATISFVQSIKYGDNEHYNPDNIHYPYETLYREQGVCGDKSILLAKLLKMQDYGVVLFSYPTHLAVGIECPYKYANFDYKGIDYCFIEATSPTRIGYIPEEYEGNVDIRGYDPDIIFVSDGNDFDLIVDLKEEEKELEEKYGEEILDMTGEIKELYIQLKDLDKEIEENNCDEPTSSQEVYEFCSNLIDEYNDIVNKYNSAID